MSRLPVVSADGNAWGTILNDFLSQAHNADGSIKNLFVNVKDPAYGAKGDGVTDDTTAIQAAINAVAGASTIFFPIGTYIISASLIINRNDVTLLGTGERGATLIQIASTADPTYALIVGNTAEAYRCSVQGLGFQGRNTTSSTGGGIQFRCTGGSIIQVHVSQFGGTGIAIAEYPAGSTFEVLVQDVQLVQCGMNTTTPGDNLTTSANTTDCEFIRVISEGDAARTTTRYGFNDAGQNNKFVACHPYQCSGAGLFAGSTSKYLQIVEGEYENNSGQGGIYLNGATRAMISGASFYANTTSDLTINNAFDISIVGVQCNSAGSAASVVVTGSGRLFLGDSIVDTSSATGLSLDSGSFRCIIHDCKLLAATTALSVGAQNCIFHDNVIPSGAITEITGAVGNSYHDNQFIASQVPTIISNTSVFRHNTGYNPVGHVTSPPFPATTVAATNTSSLDVMAFIANGTGAITVIQIAGQGGTYVTTGMQIAASGWGAIHLPAGAAVKFTYASGTPTWTWFGD